MNTFFWGYFSKPWRRLFRTISILIITFFSFFPFITDHHYDFNIIIYILYLLIITLIPIPIVSYVVEPFVLKYRGEDIHNDQSEIKKKIELEKIIKSEKYENSNNQNIKKESNFKNYFTYNHEYLTGINYLIRMIIGIITIPIFFIGLLLISTSVYKRTSSLGFQKSMLIISCILLPVLCILTIMINYTERKLGTSDDTLMSIIPLIFSISHMILVFKNGTRKRIGRFQVRE